MRKLALKLAFAALAVPVHADGLTLTIDNRSNKMVDRVNTYPVDADGDPVEDNVGGTTGVLPGTKTRYPISLYDCGLVLVSVGMAGSDEEFQTELDLCKDTVLVVKD